MSFTPTYVGDLRVPMLNIGTDGLKAHLLTCLKIEEPGSAFIHFGKEDRRGFTKEFFAALCSERCVTEYKRGQPVRYWSKEDRARNEAWDTLCLAYAACWELLKYDGMCRGLEKAKRKEEPASTPAYQTNGAAKYQPIIQTERRVVEPVGAEPVQPQAQKTVPRWLKNKRGPNSTLIR